MPGPFTPLHAQLLHHNDPLFAPVDGSDCPPVSSNQEPDSASSSMVLKYAVIRIQLAIPATASFSLVSATNPKRCAMAPGSAAISGDLFLFRRPLPSTNLLLLSAVMWDGRESLQKITTTAGEQSSTAPLLFDLADQANSATTTHAQGAPIVGTQAQQDIVNFEMGLSTAQVILVPDIGIALLDLEGSDGGANYLQNTVAPAFSIGVNNPLSPPFTNTVFTIYSAWKPTSPEYRRLPPVQQAIGRGEALFNNTTFVIHDVPGLTACRPIRSTTPPTRWPARMWWPDAACVITARTPATTRQPWRSISASRWPGRPTTTAAPTPCSTWRISRVYTLTNSSTGATVEVTDPGKAMISGSWTDVGKTKGPILRGPRRARRTFTTGRPKTWPRKRAFTTSASISA